MRNGEKKNNRYIKILFVTFFFCSIHQIYKHSIVCEWVLVCVRCAWVWLSRIQLNLENSMNVSQFYIYIIIFIHYSFYFCWTDSVKSCSIRWIWTVLRFLSLSLPRSLASLLIIKQAIIIIIYYTCMYTTKEDQIRVFWLFDRTFVSFSIDDWSLAERMIYSK